MRELQLAIQYLQKMQTRHLQSAVKIAAGSIHEADYGAIVQEAKAAEQLGRIIKDLGELEKDSGEFVKLFLS